MNLALHQFRKEVRHHRAIWLLWVALLFLQLAVDLEWVGRMSERNYVQNFFWVPWMRFAVTALTFMLAASRASEDVPGNPSRFLAGRPMPLGSYLAGRVLSVVVLVVLPLAVWEMLYLALSARPIAEVLLGGVEKAVFAALLYGWVVPFGLVWRRIGHAWLVLGLALLIGAASSYLAVSVRASLTQPLAPGGVNVNFAELAFDPTVYLVCLALAAVTLWLVAWRHLHTGWPLWRRLTIVAVIAIIAGVAPEATKSVTLPAMRPTAQAEVDALASKLSPQMERARLIITPDVNDAEARRKGERVRGAVATVDVVAPDMPNVSVYWRARSVEAEWMGERRVGSLNPSAFSDQRRVPLLNGYLAPAAVFTSDLPYQRTVASRTIASLFGPGTLVRWRDDVDIRKSAFASFRVPDSWREGEITSPSLRGTFEACFVRWELAGDMPIVQGSKLELEDARWEILQVSPHKNALSNPERGSLALHVSVQYRESLRDATPWPWRAHLVPIVYAPSKGVAWMLSARTLEFARTFTQEERASSTGWMREHAGFTWPDVLEPLAGVPVDEIPHLRLAVVRREFMGSKEFPFSTHDVAVSESNQRINVPDSMQDDATLAARINSLPDLPANATDVQAAELVASVFQSVSKYGGAKAATDKLRSVARQHSAVLLKLRAVDFSWAKVLGQLHKEFGEAQRDALIDHLPQAPWVAKIILERGWTDQARRVAEPLLASPYFPQEVQELYWKWHDPAHLPGLLRYLERNRDERQFMPLLEFPEALPALRESVARWLSHTQPVLELWKGSTGRLLVCGLAVGNTDALDLLLRFSRTMTMNERNERRLFWGRTLLPLFGQEPTENAADVGKFLDSLQDAKAADFQFDAQHRVWARVKP
ncbi:hypothetical protein AYO49_01465 [Verrucomicrobiaceae bacterium SCGC AG-212-N21]|nr:hypothetical protein AYO49_01465 [Verrucomicrobiaceae bacterium SCGC AG-212-N21]